MIHPTAVIAPGARVADSVKIGPYVVIDVAYTWADPRIRLS